MSRLVLSLLTIFSLSACQSDNKSENLPLENQEVEVLLPTQEVISSVDEVVTKLEPHANLVAHKEKVIDEDSCRTTEPLYLTDRINDLNALSQQMFALDTIDGVNGYANFLTLAQLSLTSNNDTSTLIEQVGLSGITENEEWLNVFCYLEAVTPTNEVSVSVAENWLIRDDFYTALSQKFQANFTSRTIDPEQDLWRLSLTNNWAIDIQLTIDNETPKYVNYQNASDAQNEIAHAITVTDTIHTATNESGDYYSVTNNSDYTLHIIMPTFTQYPHVKSNIIDVLNGFKALEKIQLAELSIPYFSEVNRGFDDSFMSLPIWLTENSALLLDDENQDYSGINQYESLKLLNTSNSSSFEFNSEGNITSQYYNTNTFEALFFVEEAFTNIPNASGFTLTSLGLINTSTCEEVEVESIWRPYFMIVENTSNNLIYSIAANGQPSIKDEGVICYQVVIVDDIYFNETLNLD